MATSISAMLTLYLRASALRRGSCQPGSLWTRAAAIRSASTPLAARCAGTAASTSIPSCALAARVGRVNAPPGAGRHSLCGMLASR